MFRPLTPARGSAALPPAAAALAASVRIPRHTVDAGIDQSGAVLNSGDFLVTTSVAELR